MSKDAFCLSSYCKLRSKAKEKQIMDTGRNLYAQWIYVIIVSNSTMYIINKKNLHYDFCFWPQWSRPYNWIANLDCSKIYPEASASVLNFQKCYLDPDDIAHIYQHTKFCANRSSIWPRYALLCIFQDDGSCHLGLDSSISDHPRCTRCYGVMISLNFSEVLRFYHFAILARKCPFPPILGGFGDLTPKITTSLF